MAVQASAIDLSKYIDTSLFGEQPHIRGRRIPVYVIWYSAVSNKDGVPELMYNFDLSETEALAALLYYTEHKDEIEAQLAALNEEYRHFYED